MGEDREDAGARKGKKVAKHCVFPGPMICGSGSTHKQGGGGGAQQGAQISETGAQILEIWRKGNHVAHNFAFFLAPLLASSRDPVGHGCQKTTYLLGFGRF